ncbi:MAG: biotin/lipoyl-containing protein [Melioribacteraceae bacterium]|nr:biotin/lipoyl-containing protein [Melioribacteraceae bacterium]
MAIEFKLPELGENIETAEIVKVVVSEGDTIKEDDIVLEIETDKATVEVPSEVSGKITKVHVKDGDTAKAGDVILTLEEGSNDSSDEEKTEEKKETEEEKEKETKKEETKKEETKETQKHDDKKEKPKQKSKKTETGKYEFKLPELGENIESADVTSVLVKEGDQVKEDDPVLEIETDKATVEVPIDKNGKVLEVKIKEGDQAKVGETILVIETGGETVEEEPEKTEEDKPAEKVKEEKPEEKKEEPAKSETKKEEFKAPSDATHEARQFKKELPDKIVPASPSVRRFAREIGVDIYQVGGSGPAVEFLLTM